MWASTDLELAVTQFEKMTGVRPAYGGRHPGFGTQNSLVSLAQGRYMEVLALDPAQQVSNPIVNKITGLDEPSIIAFHVQSNELEEVARILAKNNISSKGPVSMQRQRPDGGILRWRLLFPDTRDFGYAIPIFIDWMNSPHPSKTAPTGCELLRFEVAHPRHDTLSEIYRQLGIELTVVDSSQPGARAILASPNGQVILRGQL